MSDVDFPIKQGDTSPQIEAQLLDDREPIELADGVVAFVMDHVSKDVEVTGLCTILDKQEATVAYIWNAGDTDVAGRYEAEFVVDYDTPETLSEFDGDETFPPDDYLRIEIYDPVIDL